MNRLICFAAALLLLITLAYAEVGETDVIDAVASKPDSTVAVLLLHQGRKWDAMSEDLLEKKLAFYRLVITSGQLTKQMPALQGKKPRVIVVYKRKPETEFEAKLAEHQAALAKDNIELLWGNQEEVTTLAGKP
jgi:hypothetical protein